MKQRSIIYYLFIILLFPLGLRAEQKNVNDVLIVNGITYMVTCIEPLEVQVGNGTPAVDANWAGEIEIPSFIKDDDENNYSVTSIGNHAFDDCAYITSVVIPNSVRKIGSAFSNCSSLVSINLPNTITTIESGTFFGCRKLASIVIPGTVTTIDFQAFAYCESLTELFIPKSVTCIDCKNQIGAFMHCSGLTSIVVEEGNPVYDSRDNCNAIINQWNELVLGCKNTIIPESVEYIGRYSFYGCTGLTSLKIPSWIYSIGIEAFKDCLGLTSITIPSTVSFIGDPPYSGNPFTGCDNLTSIVVEDGNPKYDSRNNCNAIIETESNSLISGCKNTVIPNSIRSIESRSFYDIVSLESIDIPWGVTELDGECFYNCCGLTSVSLPRTINIIGRKAFESCESLTNITIPISIKTIGDYAFSSCRNLVSVTSELREPMSIGDRTFGYRPKATLYVPTGTKNIYQTTNGWKVFNNIEEIDMHIIGDVNEDGFVNISDMVWVINDISNGIYNIASDVNGNGIVDAKDIIQIVDMIKN